MAGKNSLDRLICYIGIAGGIAGIALAVYFFITLNGAIDAIHDTAINQTDSAIAILRGAESIVSSTAETIDSLGSFTRNSSTTLNKSADALSGMGQAVGNLASSLASIPYMPQEATGTLLSTSTGLEDAADDMRDTAGSMAEVSGNALSTTVGIQGLKQDIGNSIASLEQTKTRIEEMTMNAKIGLLLGTIVAILMFALNALNFYRQITQ